MRADLFYKINESKTISETLDGETIIINLENGTYYSVNKTGSVLWESITLGHTPATILQTLLARYEGDAAEIEASLLTCLGFLQQEGLVIELENGNDSSFPQAYTEPKTPFIPLSINRYDDMQEMILADPIHDVDQTGWPNLKQTHVT